MLKIPPLVRANPPSCSDTPSPAPARAPSASASHQGTLSKKRKRDAGMPGPRGRCSETGACSPRLPDAARASILSSPQEVVTFSADQVGQPATYVLTNLRITQESVYALEHSAGADFGVMQRVSESNRQQIAACIKETKFIFAAANQFNTLLPSGDIATVFTEPTEPPSSLRLVDVLVSPQQLDQPTTSWHFKGPHRVQRTTRGLATPPESTSFSNSSSEDTQLKRKSNLRAASGASFERGAAVPFVRSSSCPPCEIGTSASSARTTEETARALLDKSVISQASIEHFERNGRKSRGMLPIPAGVRAEIAAAIASKKFTRVSKNQFTLKLFDGERVSAFTEVNHEDLILDLVQVLVRPQPMDEPMTGWNRFSSSAVRTRTPSPAAFGDSHMGPDGVRKAFDSSVAGRRLSTQPMPTIVVVPPSTEERLDPSLRCPVQPGATRPTLPAAKKSRHVHFENGSDAHAQ